MNDEQPTWVQCSACARHRRACDVRCPFCERDRNAFRSGAGIAPSAAAIAALVALTPTQSTAEWRAGGAAAQRAAQSLPVAAYGAPAPAYGIAPPLDSPRIDVSVTTPIVKRADTARMRGIVARSVAHARLCAERALRRGSARVLDARVSVRIAANPAIAVQAQVDASGEPALAQCVESEVQRLPWLRPARGFSEVRWSFRFVVR